MDRNRFGEATRRRGAQVRGVREVALVFVLAGGVASGAQEAAKPADHRVYQLRESGVMPISIAPSALLMRESIQQAVKLTEPQKQKRRDLADQFARKMRDDIQRNRRGPRRPDAQEIEAARETVFRELDGPTLELLEPAQREYLERIQLQLEANLAFGRPEIQERLQMTKEQIAASRTAITAGKEAVSRASVFPIGLDADPKVATIEAIRAHVASPAFQAAKAKSREAVIAAKASATEKILSLLNAHQRTVFAKMVGAPIELEQLLSSGEEASSIDVRLVALSLGMADGQRADPNFKVTVIHPAYTAEHPRILFDEAHHNFHTASGRYKPFGDLVANDGYRVLPNQEPFTRTRLDGCEILVIANALGGDSMGHPDAAKPAFTDAECDAVRGWVNDGGSLLLVTDHHPMGSAAESLAKRFGVEMSKVVTSDPANSDKRSPTCLLFTSENKLLANHPITRGRDESEQVRRIETFTGQSLKGPAGSVAILKLGETAMDRSFNSEEAVSAAGRAQGIAMRYGKGRVVVLGEAAQLSAQILGVEAEPFGMNVPGIDNRQFALNIVHWLSRLLDADCRATFIRANDYAKSAHRGSLAVVRG